MALLHECGVTFGTILSEIKQHTSCLNRQYMVLSLNNIRRFYRNRTIYGVITCFQNVKDWHDNVQKMGHEMTY